ncbi:MAG: type I-E CRISPR-associated protein Cse2/CasB [Dehalococcoidia bacterium]|nr:type I-E CRISPR-associated protein Cse2/CasB [Dehalococcoidia bacterium]
MSEHAYSEEKISLAERGERLFRAIHAARFPNGDRAALRRWAPGQPLPLAFYRLWLRDLGEDPPERQLESWAVLAWSAATLGPNGHERQRPLGRALAEHGFSEGRLERLLSAPAELRVPLFMDAIRFLAAKGARLDLADAARFLLLGEGERREKLHRQIAADFYRHLPRNP